MLKEVIKKYLKVNNIISILYLFNKKIQGTKP